MLMVYYIPIWFQAIKGVTPVESGIRTIPLVLSLVTGAITGGQTTGKFGYYAPLMLASSVLVYLCYIVDNVSHASFGIFAS